ncbi:unnamed protein product [Prorocentrum cordatum]|uniref:Uncharacterized protein n=1 Tax=Prorocentrum cordatum TaxID=2364126 RepID=A0ABN9VNK6_9DINO|nr:unnamed protein product [Polarella glacialis]|mmetsp:Transcript_105474/g.283493  ORF Transcript_105474/g.283493 Transcript_105474/m.283493 type:complete len:101 (+) Transcript_105474:614-916(+)
MHLNTVRRAVSIVADCRVGYQQAGMDSMMAEFSDVRRPPMNFDICKSATAKNPLALKLPASDDEHDENSAWGVLNSKRAVLVVYPDKAVLLDLICAPAAI